MITQKIKNKYFIFFIPCILTLLFNLSIFNRYFPLSEGWWETYGYLINKGLVPYKDFKLAFPPFFILINAFYLKFTSSFLIIRIIGVVLFSINVILSQVFLEKLFDRKIAAISTVFISFILLSDPVFIAKDYHTYLNTFVILCFIAACNYSANISNRYSIIHAVLLGMSIGFVLLIKQNVGVFLSLSYLFCILISGTKLSKKSCHILLYFLGIGIPISLFLVYCQQHNISLSTINSVYFHNDSKGNIWLVLFRFIRSKAILLQIAAVFISIYIINLFKKEILFYLNIIKNNKNMTNRFITPLFIFSILATLSIHKYNFILTQTIIIISLTSSLLLIATQCLNSNKIKLNFVFLFILIPLLSLAYSSTQTAGLNSTGLYMNILFCCAYLLNVLHNEYKIKYSNFIYIIIIPTLIIIKNKVFEPYNWWGFSQSSIIKAHYKIDFPELSGIYVDKETASAFNLIKRVVQQNSKNSKDVYFYPNIPIFYLLTKKVPPYKNVVQWFDVISSKNIKSEMNDFKHKLPNVIIALVPPDFVYNGHAKLLGRKLLQHDFQEYMNYLTKTGVYCMKSYPYNYTPYQKDIKNLYIEGADTSNILILNNYNKLTISKINKTIKDEDTFIDLGKSKIFDSSNLIIHAGDIINITSIKTNFPKIISLLGITLHKPLFSLRIYIKNKNKNCKFG